MRPAPLLLAVAALAVAASGCGSDEPSAGEQRAAQARAAALDAGLDDDVADFLGLAARGPVATYQVTYPGPAEGTTLVVANRPPDRRVDVLDGEEVVQIRFVLDGEAWECEPGDDGEVDECTRTDALVEPPGLFRDDALAELTQALRDRRDDFTFRVEERRVAGVEGRCLVTERKPGRERSELGRRGELCVSPDGALLRVDQQDESLEATDYSTDIPDGTFELPG